MTAKDFFIVALFGLGAGGLAGCGIEAVPDDTPWNATAAEWRGQNGSTHVLQCASDGTASSVWGTDVYTDDSSICTAAVHAGHITFELGGTVTIVIQPGQASYTGSARNGVTSLDYGSWEGSFSFL